VNLFYGEHFCPLSEWFVTMELPEVDWFDETPTLPSWVGWSCFLLGSALCVLGLLVRYGDAGTGTSLWIPGTFWLCFAIHQLGPAYTSGRRLDAVLFVPNAIVAGVILWYLAQFDATFHPVVALAPVASVVLAVFCTSGFVLVTGLHRSNPRPCNLVMTALVVTGVTAVVVVPSIYFAVEAGVLR
jgi:hypothetical protein